MQQEQLDAAVEVRTVSFPLAHLPILASQHSLHYPTKIHSTRPYHFVTAATQTGREGKKGARSA
jgi:hypothetical protein